MNYSINNYNLKLIGDSNNYLVFQFVLNKKNYVLKTLNTKASARNRLKKSYNILKYLDNKGLKTAEKVFYLDKTNRYLISEYIEGKEMGLQDLKGKHLKLFIKELVKLNHLKVDPKICKIVTPLQFKRRTLINAHLVKKNPKTKAIAKICLNYLKALKIKEKSANKLFFDHADLAGANIFLTKKQQFKFIDWDNARLTNDLSFIMANMFYYASYFNKDKQDHFIDLYFKEAKLDCNRKEFKQELKKNYRLVVLSGVVWALKIALKSESKIIYLKLAKERLDFFRQIS